MFGLPLLPEKGRGRPAHVWTAENSNKVSLLFACGHKSADIARVLGITKPTFYKHYFNEIARAGHAPLMMKARQLERLNQAAEGGNVAAEKALAGMIQAEQVRTLGEKIKDRGRSEGAPSPRLGKKEAAKEAAANASGKFAARTPPPLLLN
jgi:hypothetical protein